MTAGRVCVCLAAVCLAWAVLDARSSLTDAELFRFDRVWTVQLTLAADEWALIQPRLDPRAATGAGYTGGPGARNGIAAAIGVEFPWGHADLRIDDHDFRDVGIRYKGNGTYLESEGGGKISFKIDTNQFVKGQKIGGLSTFNLHSSVTDPSWMRESLAYRLYRDAGVPAPRTAYARVFVTVPGRYSRKYLGLYVLVENVDHDLIADRFGRKEGALFKPVTRTPFPDLGNQWSQYERTFDPKMPPTPQAEARTIAFCKSVAHAKDDEFRRRLGDFVALEPFAAFMAVSVWLSNPDSLIDGGQNFYMYLPPGGDAFQFIPWDLEHAFGDWYFFTPEELQTLPIDAPARRGDNLFLERVFKVPEFKALYHDRLRELTATLAQPARLRAQVEALAPVLRPAVAEETPSRLAWFDRAAAGEPYVLPDNPYPITPIGLFAERRTASVLAQLAKLKGGSTLTRSPLF